MATRETSEAVMPRSWWQRRGHDRWKATAESAGDTVKDIEHYRVEDTRTIQWTRSEVRNVPALKLIEDIWPGPYTHIAVIVMTSGACFVGVHRTARDKQYVRKNSYAAAVGKGLKLAGWRAMEPDARSTLPDFHIDTEFERADLYKAVKAKLMETNRLRA